MVAGIFARVRSLWRGLRHRAEIEAEMREEFLHHVRLRTEDLMRRGLSARVAARQARLEFGHVEGHKEDARASRGLRLFDQIGFSWLDVKLGVRMLAKYPGLSLVSVIGISVAIAIGAGGFGLIHATVDAPLPLDEGERIVTVHNADAAKPFNQDQQTAHDFLQWRDQLTTVRDLAAFTPRSTSLFIPGGSVDQVRIAHMTPSGFRVARVAPILGRPLLDDDERPGAPPVLVIAHEEWQHRFGGDPGIIGWPVRLDGETHTVVGVMPEGFRFPVNHHYWVPLRLDPSAHEIGGGPGSRYSAASPTEPPLRKPRLS